MTWWPFHPSEGFTSLKKKHCVGILQQTSPDPLSRVVDEGNSPQWSMILFHCTWTWWIWIRKTVVHVNLDDTKTFASLELLLLFLQGHFGGWHRDHELGLLDPGIMGGVPWASLQGTPGLEEAAGRHFFHPKVTAVIVNSSLEQAAKDKSLLYLCQQMHETCS